jgi:DNA-binding MarR family transcriptional regulator
MRKLPDSKREVLFQLSDVARAMRTYVDHCAREHGMTRAQWAVLVRLERNEGMMQAEMAEALDIQPISAARLIDRLCDHGLLERRPHPSDRRANRLYLTQEGRAMLAELAPLGGRIADVVLGSFGDAKIAAFLRQLLEIKDNIRKTSMNGSKPAAHGGRHAG